MTNKKKLLYLKKKLYIVVNSQRERLSGLSLRRYKCLFFGSNCDTAVFHSERCAPR